MPNISLNQTPGKAPRPVSVTLRIELVLRRVELASTLAARFFFVLHDAYCVYPPYVCI